MVDYTTQTEKKSERFMTFLCGISCERHGEVEAGSDLATSVIGKLIRVVYRFRHSLYPAECRGIQGRECQWDKNRRSDRPRLPFRWVVLSAASSRADGATDPSAESFECAEGDHWTSVPEMRECWRYRTKAGIRLVRKFCIILSILPKN